MNDSIKRLKEYAHAMFDHALDMQDELRRLEAMRADDDEIATVALNYVEGIVENTLDAIHEAQQRRDSMPVFVSLRAAE